MVDEKEEPFERVERKLNFHEFLGRSFDEGFIHKPLSQFKPIASFLSEKYNLPKK